MTFLWPEALILLLTGPALLLFYVVLGERKRTLTAQFRSKHALSQPSSVGRPLREHLPATVMVLGITALCIAIARPHAIISVASSSVTVVFAVDVSASMHADDAGSAGRTRLAESQALAKRLVAEQSGKIRFGLVAFAENAISVLAPTTKQDVIYSAIDRLSVQRGTAIASGITSALTMLFPRSSTHLTSSISNDKTDLLSGPEAGHSSNLQSVSKSQGPYSSGTVVLFSDGESTIGPDVLEAARLAAERGVRIHTVGIGSVEGKTMRVDGWTMRVRLDETTLKRIAATTGGHYFRAAAGIEWSRIEGLVQPETVVDKRNIELTALFSLAGAIIACAGAFISLVRCKRIF